MNYQEWLDNIESNKHIGVEHSKELSLQQIVDIGLVAIIDVLVAEHNSGDVIDDKTKLQYQFNVGENVCYCSVGVLLTQQELEHIMTNKLNGTTAPFIPMFGGCGNLDLIQSVYDDVVTNVKLTDSDFVLFMQKHVFPRINKVEKYDSTNIIQYINSKKEGV